MANRYWVGGTDGWGTAAGNKWASTSGGAGGQAAPTVNDIVYFDGNSGSGTVSINMAFAERLIVYDWAGTFIYGNSTGLNIEDGRIEGSDISFAGVLRITSSDPTNVNLYVQWVDDDSSYIERCIVENTGTFRLNVSNGSYTIARLWIESGGHLRTNGQDLTIQNEIHVETGGKLVLESNSTIYLDGAVIEIVGDVDSNTCTAVVDSSPLGNVDMFAAEPSTWYDIDWRQGNLISDLICSNNFTLGTSGILDVGVTGKTIFCNTFTAVGQGEILFKGAVSYMGPDINPNKQVTINIDGSEDTYIVGANVGNVTFVATANVYCKNCVNVGNVTGARFIYPKDDFGAFF